MPEEEAERARAERVARSVALEQAYVHDVYDQIGTELAQSRQPVLGRVENFLRDLEPGSLVADVGCGDGRYLSINSSVFAIGSDRSSPQTKLARERKQEAVVGDNLRLPYRDEAFDAIVSASVVHHLATTERRVNALRELARVLRVGGKLLITVRAMDEQCKFESQDVLVPWYHAVKTRKRKDNIWSEEKDNAQFGDECEEQDEDDDDDDDSISLASSDEEDALVSMNCFPAFGVPDLSSGSALKRQNFGTLRGDRLCHSLDVPAMCPSDVNSGSAHSSPEQQVPRDSCYGFVRRALKRLSSYNSSTSSTSSFPLPLNSENVSGRFQRHSWFGGSSVDSAFPPSPAYGSTGESKFCLLDEDGIHRRLDDMHIELRNLDEDDEVFGLTAHPQPENTLDKTSRRDGSLRTGLTQKNKLVRSLSEIFKNIPGLLWNRERRNKSQSDLVNPLPSAKSSLEYLLGYDLPTAGIVRSKTTATCTFQFEHISRLDSVEEMESLTEDLLYDRFNSLVNADENQEKSKDYLKTGVELTMTSLTSSDIANGNIIPVEDNITDPGSQYAVETLLTKQQICVNEQRDVESINMKNSILSKSQVRWDAPVMSDDIAKITTAYTEKHIDHSEVKGSENLSLKRSRKDEDFEDVIDHFNACRFSDRRDSPKRHRRGDDRQENWQMVYSKTFGPFYDSEYDSDEDECVVLSSYYSMPELYNLSDYVREYSTSKYIIPRKEEGQNKTLKDIPKLRRKDETSDASEAIAKDEMKVELKLGKKDKIRILLPKCEPGDCQKVEKEQDFIGLKEKPAVVQPPLTKNGSERLSRKAQSSDVDNTINSSAHIEDSGEILGSSQVHTIHTVRQSYPNRCLVSESERCCASMLSKDAEENGNWTGAQGGARSKFIDAECSRIGDAIKSAFSSPRDPSSSSSVCSKHYCSLKSVDEENSDGNEPSIAASEQVRVTCGSSKVASDCTRMDSGQEKTSGSCCSPAECTTACGTKLAGKESDNNRNKRETSETSCSSESEKCSTNIKNDSLVDPGLNPHHPLVRQVALNDNLETSGEEALLKLDERVGSISCSNAQQMQENCSDSDGSRHCSLTKTTVLNSVETYSMNTKCPKINGLCLRPSTDINVVNDPIIQISFNKLACRSAQVMDSTHLITLGGSVHTRIPEMLSINNNNLQLNDPSIFSSKPFTSGSSNSISNELSESLQSFSSSSSSSISVFSLDESKTSAWVGVTASQLHKNPEHQNKKKDDLLSPPSSIAFKYAPADSVVQQDNCLQGTNQLSSLPPLRCVEELETDIQANGDLINENSFGKLEMLSTSSEPTTENGLTPTDKSKTTKIPQDLLCILPRTDTIDSIHGHVNSEDATVTLHRYYHVFREGELEDIIERHVENLHVLSSSYDHSCWCIVAEKVHVWTI